jgi:hypothetical protein
MASRSRIIWRARGPHYHIGRSAAARDLLSDLFTSPTGIGSFLGTAFFCLHQRTPARLSTPPHAMVYEACVV